MSSSKEATLEDIEAEGISNAKEHLQNIYAIWQEFGIELSQKTDRARVVWNHVHNLLKDIYEEENTFCEDIKERIKNYTKKIKDLCNILGLTPNEPKGSLIKIEEMLRQELDTLTKLKHRRVKSYQDLKSVELQYCQILNLQEHQLPSNTGVPSENDLSELEEHIKMLKDEKDRRQKKFFLAKKELTTILETTELTPESSLERDIMSGKDTLSLTNETFKALEEVINKAQKRKAELENKKKRLIDQLTVLWQRLNVEESRRVEFLSKHVDCRLSTIQSIEQELEKCETIKKANLGSFISNLRIELLQLWDKCHVSQPERDLFHYFLSTDLSDEVLEAHEAEVDKWKKYYAKVEHILKKIEKRRHLWDMMIVFENKAADPNRFKNRKGNLLQEEKERKKLQKDLPALENNIFCEIDELEADGSTFMFNGEDFKTFVTNQWNERINQKESEKMERQNKHLLQIGNEATLGTPLKRPMKTTTTPKSCPSKLFKSTMGVSVFRTPAPSHSRVVPSTVGKVAAKNAKLFPGRPSAVQKKEHNILKERNKQVAAAPPPNDAKAKAAPHNSTTYTDFASEMNKTSRYNFRSSVLATKKRGGSRISQTEINHSKRKSAAKSLRKSMRNTSKTSTNLTPARGKLGLPFLI